MMAESSRRRETRPTLPASGGVPVGRHPATPGSPGVRPAFIYSDTDPGATTKRNGKIFRIVGPSLQNGMDCVSTQLPMDSRKEPCPCQTSDGPSRRLRRWGHDETQLDDALGRYMVAVPLTPRISIRRIDPGWAILLMNEPLPWNGCPLNLPLPPDPAALLPSSSPAACTAPRARMPSQSRAPRALSLLRLLLLARFGPG